MARSGDARDHRWREWTQRPDALSWALVVALLWAEEHGLATSTDEHLDAMVALVAGEAGPARRVWGPLCRLAVLLLEESTLSREGNDRLPSYWTHASVRHVPEGWQARVGWRWWNPIAATWPTREAAELTCRALRPGVRIEVLTESQ